MPRCRQTILPSFALGVLSLTASAIGQVAMQQQGGDSSKTSGVLPTRDSKANGALAALPAANRLSTEEGAGRRVIAQPRTDAARTLCEPWLVTVEQATGEWLLALGAGMDRDAWIAAARITGEFALIVPDDWCLPLTDLSGIPSDPLYGRQWHLASMHAAHAWRFAEHHVALGAAPVTLAVVDTGLDLALPDLLNIRQLGASSAGSLVWQTSLDDAILADSSGHGTAVAGVAAAEVNNAIGTAGLGRTISLLPIKASASPSGGALLSDILRGVRAAADAGASVVSVSYAGITSPAVEVTGQYVRANSNAIVLWAAGNNAATLDESTNWPSVLIVGATDRNGELATFSARGAAVDFFAPGTDVLTSAPTELFPTGSRIIGGTSFSTPLAAATAALAKQIYPQLTAAELTLLLRESAALQPLPATPGVASAAGLLDAARTVVLAARASDAPMGARTSEVIALGDRAAVIRGQITTIDVLGNDLLAISGSHPTRISDYSLPADAPIGVSIRFDAALGRDVLDIDARLAPAALLGTTVELEYAAATADVGEPARGAQVARISLVLIDGGALTQPPGYLRFSQGLDTFTRPSAEGSPSPGQFPALAFIPIGLCSVPQPGPLGVADIRTVTNDLYLPLADQFVPGTTTLDNFSIAMRGLLQVPAAGEYTFTLTAEAAARLAFVDLAATGTLPALESSPSVMSANAIPGVLSIALAAGAHPIAIELSAGSGPWGLTLEVTAPLAGVPFAAPIPQEWLARVVAMADVAGSDGVASPDGLVTGADFAAFAVAFAADESLADIAGGDGNAPGDGSVDGNDFQAFLNAFAAGC